MFFEVILMAELSMFPESTEALSSFLPLTTENEILVDLLLASLSELCMHAGTLFFTFLMWKTWF